MGIVRMPKMGDTMEEGTIAKWYKAVGDQVTEGEEIAEIETEKAAIAIEVFESGPLTKILVQEGETVPVGEPIAIVGVEGDAGGPTAEASPQPSPGNAPDTIAQEPPVTPAPGAAPSASHLGSLPFSAERVVASPLARRIAREQSVDLHGIQGTGPNGRIVAEDVQSAAQGHGSRMAPRPSMGTERPAPSVPTPMPAPTGDVWRAGKPLSQMRKTIARRLSESKQQVPHYQVTMEINMGPAMSLRGDLNTRGEGFARIGPNDLIVKAVADALRAHEAMRAAYVNDQLLTTDRVNVGVAVALPEGLIVPVVRDADTKPLNDIAREIRALVEKARAGKLQPDEYSGGTFSVSNLGMFGVDDFNAIINPPEPGILAIGGIFEKPVVENGQVVIGTRMRITLSADHRVVDGAVGAEFLQEVKRRLENPLTLVR